MEKQASSSPSPWQTASDEPNPTATETLTKLSESRWLVLVASLWLQACSGIGYAFGGYSPLVKSTLGYSQQQITLLGIAKDFGANTGLIAGFLSGVLPTWSLLAIGAVHIFLGYGWLWLIITGHSPILPMWAVCTLILVGSNGLTYLNTESLVTNVSNFPKSRGYVSGLLKGFNGLCSAIFTQIYITFFVPDQAAYLLIIALGPTMMSLLMMFIVRRIKPKEEGNLYDAVGFFFVYGDSLMIAAYLMGVSILQDVMSVSFKVRVMFTTLLLVMVGLPLATPMVLLFAERASRSRESVVKKGEGSSMDMEEKGVKAPLMKEYEGEDPHMQHEEEKSIQSNEEEQGDMDLTSRDKHETVPGEKGFTSKDVLYEKQQQDTEIVSSNICEKGAGEMVLAAMEGSAMLTKKEGPYEGEGFTLGQALGEANFWLLFVVQLCGAGTGMAAIDNIGQISQSQGYSNSSVFVSMISIFNFLGRLLGGYFSEILVRHVLPRSWAICLAQGMLGVGYFVIAMGWSKTLYVGTLLVGIGYGSLFGSVTPMISELFGIKSFGIFYNIYNMATPAGALFFSGFLIGYLYDTEAAKQSTLGMIPIMTSTTTSCSGASCFCLSFLIMTSVCILGILMATILSIRTNNMYRSLYGNNSAPR